jgi:hypothetical protein
LTTLYLAGAKNTDIAVVEVAHVTAMLAVDTSTREAAAARDSIALHVKDAED